MDTILQYLIIKSKLIFIQKLHNLIYVATKTLINGALMVFLKTVSAKT